MTSFRNRIVFSCLSIASAAGLVSFSDPAMARSVPVSIDEVRQVSVSHADLDLSSIAGQATFDQRVGRAASSVCTQPMVMSRIPSAAETTCRRDALIQARRDAGLDHEFAAK